MAYEREAQTDIAALKLLAAGLTPTTTTGGYEREAQSDLATLQRLAVGNADPGATGGYERVGQIDVAALRRRLLNPPASGLNDGDPVSTWPDSSGNGHDATQTGTARPIFKTNILNGKPVVRFTTTGQSGLNLAVALDAGGPRTEFVVMKSATPASQLYGLYNNTTGAFPFGMLLQTDGTILFSGHTYYWTFPSGVIDRTSFHVFTDTFDAAETNIGGGNMFVDGNSQFATQSPFASTANLTRIGYRDPAIGTPYSDGDIAEIIVYSGTLALRAKLIVLLTALITTGEFPSPAEFDAMVGDRHKIAKYLHQQGAHPTNAQLDDVVTPMALGDRANIEKYLGTKYGITVFGGTAVDPSTVAGLVGWWKADSLG